MPVLSVEQNYSLGLLGQGGSRSSVVWPLVRHLSSIGDLTTQAHMNGPG